MPLTNRAYSAQQAQIQRGWETQMSDTAVQRQSADMEAAGINPELAAGSQASTPSGAAASATYGSGPLAALQQAVSIANAKTARDQMNSQSALNLSAAANNQASAAKSIADIGNGDTMTAQNVKESNSRIALNSAYKSKAQVETKGSIQKQVVAKPVEQTSSMLSNFLLPFVNSANSMSQAANSAASQVNYRSGNAKSLSDFDPLELMAFL